MENPKYQEGFFLRRPVFSSVISIIIVLAGLLAIRVLPVAQYPDLVPPTVMVIANYPGASPEDIANTVASPLEQQINGVDDMIYMDSVSSVSGLLTMTVSFEVGTDPEIAQVNVSNRVQAALPMLPEIVRRFGVSVMKYSPAMLQVLTITSPGGVRDDIFLSNYALINLLDGLKRLPGVGDAQILGSKDYAMRIWLNPQRMAQLGLSPSDISMAVQDQNNQYAAGTIGALPSDGDVRMTWQIHNQGRLVTAEEFGNIILRTDENGGVLRLRDVARVELGTLTYDFAGTFDGVEASVIAIFLAPGANALATADAVDGFMQQQAKAFPVGVDYDVAYDTTTFVRISIEEVVKTLVEAMLLVFLVVFLFLQDWRATLIPCLAVPIALIGTFAGIQVLGFTINTLTLFALVLAIGMVVDDAIVVLENVERILRTERLTVRQATAKAMSEVTAPVIAIVLVLCAVFIPVAFLGGLAGVMYRQFAITIAIAVVISGVVALTLTPSLCVLLLKEKEHEPGAFFRMFNRGFDAVTDGFSRAVNFFLKAPVIAVLVFVAICAGSFQLFRMVPTSLVPDEDQGMLMCMVSLPDGAAMPQTQDVMNRVSEQVQQIPGVQHVTALSGFDLMSTTLNTNQGTMFITLDDWGAREKIGADVQTIIREIYILGLKETKALVLPFNPPPISGMSNTGGFEMMLQSTESDPKALSDMARNFVAEAAKRPELTGLSTTFSINAPRLFIDLNREKARMLRVNVGDVFNTLGATLGSTYINDFNMMGRTFKVYMQADAPFRSLPSDISSLYTRSMNGDQVPIISLVNVTTDSGPKLIEHFNSLIAAKITGNPAPGYSSGQAIQALNEVAADVLPQGYSHAWSGTSYQEVATGGTNFGVLGFGMLMVFLILAAQYERWSLPLAVVTAVPFAVFGAIFANWLIGLSNDVYTQVAMITLMGLACKNAILIVEFAADLHRQGKGVAEAAAEAAKLRFRPIIMTSIAFILGCMPLALSTGAGAGGREAIGVSVVSGMLAATVLAPLLVPSFYELVMRVAEKFQRKKTEV